MMNLVLLMAVAAGPTEVYSVDLGRAVSATPAGRAIGKKLEKLHREAEAAIRREEERISTERLALGPKGYEKALEALQKQIAATEKRLGAEQDRLLAPELTRLESYLDAAEKRTGGSIRIVPRSEAAFVAAPKACDLTGWLIKTARAGAIGPMPTRAEDCRFHHFFYVGFDEALAGMASAAQAKARLDQLKERYQSELNKWQKQLAEIRAKADRTRDPKWEKEHLTMTREVERKFARLQKQLEQRELSEQTRLYASVEAALRSLAQKVKGVGFVEKLGNGGASLSPSCDITAFVAASLNGEASLADLKRACPSYQPPKKGKVGARPPASE